MRVDQDDHITLRATDHRPIASGGAREPKPAPWGDEDVEDQGHSVSDIRHDRRGDSSTGG
jgi:hypothetical protein